MNFEQIKDLVELMADRGLGRLEIERSGFRLEIEANRGDAGVVVGESQPSVSVGLTAPATRPPETVAAPVVQATTEQEPAAPDAEDELPPGTHIMNSPIVGTFYRSPNPDAAAFVDVGDTIEQGAVLCIVEAMKLMNEIESEVGGKVLKIFPQNGQPVEFGEPLFAIKSR